MTARKSARTGSASAAVSDAPTDKAPSPARPARKRGRSESEGDAHADLPAAKKGARTKHEEKQPSHAPAPALAHDRTDEHARPLHALGEVLVCGMNECGQLGIPGSTSFKRLKTVPGLPKARAIAAGGMHTVAACQDGKVYSWGVNDEGALGRPSDADNEDKPFPIEGLDAHAIVAVVAGDSHSAVLTARGELFAWGTFRDANGVMGFSVDTHIQATPRLVYPVPGHPADPLVKVASGCSHIAGLTASGQVVTWGSCEQGQLGRTGSKVPARRLKETLLVPHPVDLSRCIKRGSSARPSAVACGNYHTLVLYDDKCISFGLNNHGQCGVATKDTIIYAPRTVELSGEKPVGAAGGLHHSLLVAESGKLFSCGNGVYGRLGLGDANDRTEFTHVERLSDSKVVSVSCGVCASYAVSADGKAFSWGMGEGGMLGLGDEDDRETPERIEGRELERPGSKVLFVSAGGQHTIVVVDRPPASEGAASAPQTPVAPAKP